MLVSGKSRTIFFPSNTLIYGISRDGSKDLNIRTCEHMILGQLTMGARQTKNAPCLSVCDISLHQYSDFFYCFESDLLSLCSALYLALNCDLLNFLSVVCMSFGLPLCPKTHHQNHKTPTQFLPPGN